MNRLQLLILLRSFFVNIRQETSELSFTLSSIQTKDHTETFNRDGTERRIYQETVVGTKQNKKKQPKTDFLVDRVVSINVKLKSF